MGSGKSSLGRQLSDLMNLGFLDLDEMFEEKFRISIFDFFEKYGEEQFRKIERDLLMGTSGFDQVVISTGGGTACFQDNMTFITGSGKSVYIRMTAEELAERLESIKKKRPLLKGLDQEDLKDWVRTQLERREKFYLLADFIFHPLKDDLKWLAEVLK